MQPARSRPTMGDSTDPVSEATPLEGDLVVSCEARSAVRYTVRRVPGRPQFSASELDEALRLARGYALMHGVDIWYDENGSYRPLETYRPRKAASIENQQA